MASRAGPPIDLSLKNALAQGDLVRRCARRYRKRSCAGIGMNALWRQRVARCRTLCCGRRGRRGRNSARLVPTLEGDAPNPTALIVGVQVSVLLMMWMAVTIARATVADAGLAPSQLERGLPEPFGLRA